jgi:hypothetical protein
MGIEKELVISKIAADIKSTYGIDARSIIERNLASYRIEEIGSLAGESDLGEKINFLSTCEVSTACRSSPCSDIKKS